MKTFSASLVLMIGFSWAACGGGGSSVTTTPPPPAFTPVPIIGQWEFEGLDAAGNVVLIETNLAVSSTDDFGATTGNTVTIDGTSINNKITLENLGLACDNGETGFDSVNGTFTSATGAGFTALDHGPAGTFSTAGTLTFDAVGTTASGLRYSRRQRNRCRTENQPFQRTVCGNTQRWCQQCDCDGDGRLHYLLHYGKWNRQWSNSESHGDGYWWNVSSKRNRCGSASHRCRSLRFNRK